MAAFFGGVPTRRQVDILMREVNAIPGTEVSLETIAALIGEEPRSARCRTVAGVWRRRLYRERNIQTSGASGVIRLLTPDEAHDAGLRDVHRVGRATGRVHRRIDSIPAQELSDRRRDQHNLMRREIAAIHAAIQQSARIIAGPKPVTASVVRMATRERQ
jgi:uncharacterized protein (DUF885 family)